MQFIVVLLLIVGVVVVVAIMLMGASYGYGVQLYSREWVRPDPADKGPCAQCNADRDWYTSLPMWKQNVTAVWWWANRLQCAAQGCK